MDMYTDIQKYAYIYLYIPIPSLLIRVYFYNVKILNLRVIPCHWNCYWLYKQWWHVILYIYDCIKEHGLLLCSVETFCNDLRLFRNNISMIPHSLNSFPLSAAYMRQLIGKTLFRIMACNLLVPSHYLDQCLVIDNWALRNKLQWI